MTVNYKLVSGGSYTLLLNESAGDSLDKFAPSFEDKIYDSGGYGAANANKVAMSNTVGQTVFKWSSNYASAAAALAAINTLRTTFKGVPVHLQVIQDTTTLYLPNAVLNSSNHDPRGKECLHSLTFKHDDITSTAP